jgi:serine/threonine protein kinase
MNLNPEDIGRLFDTTQTWLLPFQLQRALPTPTLADVLENLVRVCAILRSPSPGSVNCPDRDGQTQLIIVRNYLEEIIHTVLQSRPHKRCGVSLRDYIMELLVATDQPVKDAMYAIKSKRKERKQVISIDELPAFMLSELDTSFRTVDLQYVDIKIEEPLEVFLSQFNEFPVNTGSGAGVFRGTWGDRLVYVKSFPDDETTVNLKYEKEVYRYIRSLSQANRIFSRHFVELLVCVSVDNPSGIACITQDSDGGTLYDFMNSKPPTVERTFAVYLELLYVIYLLRSAGIVHNDLHSQNVIVCPTRFREAARYDMYGMMFDGPAHDWYLKVYDFDRANIVDPEMPKNTWLNDEGFCDEFGQCQDLQKDMFNWFVMLTMETPQPQYDDFTQSLALEEGSSYYKLIEIVERNLTGGPKEHWQRLCDYDIDTDQYVDCGITPLPVLEHKIILETFHSTYSQF